MTSLLLVLVGASGLTVALTRSSASGGAQSPGTSQPAYPGATSRPVDWVEVLGRLDARRSRAFAVGDVGGLDRVYVDGSAALRTDRRLLQRYLDRGLRVTGLRMRVVDVRLLETGDRHAVLRVRDRVVAGRAEDDDGSTWRLRDDAWSRHRMRLEYGDDGWRIAEIELGS